MARGQRVKERKTREITPDFSAGIERIASKLYYHFLENIEEIQSGLERSRIEKSRLQSKVRGTKEHFQREYMISASLQGRPISLSGKTILTYGKGNKFTVPSPFLSLIFLERTDFGRGTDIISDYRFNITSYNSERFEEYTQNPLTLPKFELFEMGTHMLMGQVLQKERMNGHSPLISQGISKTPENKEYQGKKHKDIL